MSFNFYIWDKNLIFLMVFMWELRWNIGAKILKAIEHYTCQCLLLVLLLILVVSLHVIRKARVSQRALKQLKLEERTGSLHMNLKKNRYFVRKFGAISFALGSARKKWLYSWLCHWTYICNSYLFIKLKSFEVFSFIPCLSFLTSVFLKHHTVSPHVCLFGVDFYQSLLIIQRWVFHFCVMLHYFLKLHYWGYRSGYHHWT